MFMMFLVTDNLTGYMHHCNVERKIRKYVIVEVLVVMQQRQVLYVVGVHIYVTMGFLVRTYLHNAYPICEVREENGLTENTQ
jgi:hypothetical protein